MNARTPGPRNPRRMPGDWRRLRRAVLERDGWRCVKCGRAGRLEVDHIKPAREGGTDALTNLQALCRPCHFAKTAQENARRAKPIKGRAEWKAHLADLLRS